MADKRISQLVDRGTVVNNDVIPIVVSGATTTNKATISSIQTFMQGNLDVGVTSVGITVGSSGTDVNVSGSPVTSSGNITINIPSASATNRGLVTTGSQTIAGIKSFDSTVVINQDIQLITQGTALNTFIKNINAAGLTSIGSNGFGFNNSNNIYFSGSSKGGGIFAFSNTGNQTYTLQDASGTLAFTSDISTALAAYVTLATSQTITAQKTFTTSGGTDSVIISTTGAGFALDAIKAGNGEVIRVTKTSGTGNAMTVIGGNFEAPTIVKTGGTSSQFLKADGSIDSNSYVTLDTTQTITGAKTFETTTSTFALMNSTNANGGVLSFRRNGTNVGHIGNSAQLGGGVLDAIEVRSGTGSSVILKTDGGQLTLATGGAVTLTGALNGTSGSFTGNISAIGNNSMITVSYADIDTGNNRGLRIINSDASEGTSYNITAGRTGQNNGDFVIRNTTTGVNNLFFNRTTGAATFSSSVTASSLIAASATLSNFGSATAAVVGFGDENTGFFRPAANSLSITTNGVQRQIINSDGAMGFNYPILGSRSFVFRTISGRPLTLETIAPTGIHSLYLRPNDSGRHLISSNYLSGGVYLPLALSGRENDSDLVLGINGNVGIGTATPDSRLSVFGTFRNYLSSGAGGQTLISAILGVSNGYLINVDTSNNITHTWHTGANAVSMQITSVGDLYLGSSSVTAANTSLYFFKSSGLITQVFAYSSGTSVIQEFYRQGAGQVGSISYNGTATLYNSTSDYRLKEDLQDFNGLEIVSKLKTYDFNWKDADVRDYGMIAHELQEVLPNYVSGEKDAVDVDGNVKPQGVDYSKIVPILIKAIQEQQEQINQLKNQIK